MADEEDNASERRQVSPEEEDDDGSRLSSPRLEVRVPQVRPKVEAPSTKEPEAASSAKAEEESKPCRKAAPKKEKDGRHPVQTKKKPKAKAAAGKTKKPDGPIDPLCTLYDDLPKSPRSTWDAPDFKTNSPRT